MTYLSSCHEELIQDFCLASLDYEDMRDLMLESTCYTPADAARSLFAAPSIKREQRTASGMWRKVESQLARLRSTAKSMEDLSNMISMGYVATHVGIECADYVDLRKPKSARKYARVFAEYDSRSKVLVTSTSKQEQQFETKWCNYCRRKRHLEVDCFKKKKTEVSKETEGPKEKETPQQTKSETVTSSGVCYLCREPGHRKRDCPKRRDCKRTLRRMKAMDDGRITSLKTDAIVNGHKCRVVLDTGADASIVPRAYISKMDMDGGKITISGAMGIHKVYQTAKVTVNIGNEAWDEVVAVSSDNSNGEIILAMDMVDETDCNIMVKVAGELRNSLGEEAGNNRKVRKVTTRSMVKKSESNGIATTPEHQSVHTSDSAVVNFQHSSGEEESAEGEQTGLALEAEHSGEEESAVEEQSGFSFRSRANHCG